MKGMFDMTITFKKLIDATEAFRKLSNQELGVKKAVEVSRLIRKLEKEYDVYKENYSKLVKKYGKLKNEESDEYDFDDDARKSFSEELMKLLDLECNIDCEKIKIDEDIRLSAIQVIALEDFVDFKE